ncbi:hypothetical protein [Longimicrobium terrae]|uniref:Uncharacterized protein n=1 Tax=Longimicrobium terrae TaxID=1639882 RepID=A0A841GRL0_9BACT|nr:hypothetical protein [Longimicrobium terrae]MBB4634201.1 hypothetical protein [Longimicrobium terrae]MBB6068909.1 hypothetical protein [Longimicrobium terrae]NNC28089.1 hypothetical protein [Longimicrobium terrae]
MTDQTWSELLPSVIVGVLAGAAGVGIGLSVRGAVRRAFQGRDAFEIDEAELGVGSQKLVLRANREDVRVAYQLWVELSTRKIGLPIDYDDDVIVEIYDSWYHFFGITRELIKDIPPSKLRSGESIQALIQLSIDVLNEGMRPHLTRWQARFRRWYDRELSNPDNILVEPQELQKRFPRYDELTDDMDLVNARLMYYRDQMRKFVFGESAQVVK